MTNQTEQEILREIQQGIIGMIAAYERGERGAMFCSNRGLYERIPIPYTRERSLQRGLEHTLENLNVSLRCLPEGVSREPIIASINALQNQLIPAQEAQRQRDLNDFCRGYTAGFECRIESAFALISGEPEMSERGEPVLDVGMNSGWMQGVLPKETRELNGRSALESLRSLAQQPITEQNLPNLIAELGRIQRTFLYSVGELYSDYQDRRGIIRTSTDSGCHGK